MPHRRERTQRRDGEEPAAPVRPPAQSRDADRVLALQRSAGNRAVTSVIARDTKTKPKEPEKGADAAPLRAVLPGIGTIPLLSSSFNMPGPGGGSGGGGKDQSPKEMVFTSKAGDHSPLLLKASLEGGAMDVEVIMERGETKMTIRLKGAIVSSYNTSGDTETWTLNFQAIEQDRPRPGSDNEPDY